MRIRADGTSRLTTLQFRLQSINMNFRCMAPYSPSVYDSCENFDPPNDVQILFEDGMELNELIEMLKAFQKKCNEKTGIWRKEY